MALTIARSLLDLRLHAADWTRQGETFALVPTMGGLHDGHLALVRRAKELCDRCVASVFVNPTQFAAHEDYGAYPRDETGDADKLASVGCDLLYAPDVEVMYPPDFSTAVLVSGVSDDLEGAVRPHFFGGVATVVTKLLMQALPNVAIFGEKDYQQLVVIRKLVRDLDFATEIVGVETVREMDGLAMSSRNAYLSAHERAIAGRLSHVLFTERDALERGGRIETTLERARVALIAAGFDDIDYVAVRGEDLALMPSDWVDRPARLLAAVRIGATRLIDNVAIDPAPPRPLA